MAETTDGQPNLGVLLLVSYRAMEERVFAALREAGFGDFTIAQAGCSSGSRRAARGSPTWPVRRR